MNETVHWHVLFTKQQCERKVLNALLKRGYQCFCPYHPVSTQWKDQEKPFTKPLFDSYVFVRCTEMQFPDIKRTPGVINFLYRLHRPAVVTNEDMTAIRHAINHYQEIEVLKTGLKVLVNNTHPESDTFTHFLSSLGFTLKASKEKLTSKALIPTEELNSRFQRLSFRFRLAWR